MTSRSWDRLLHVVIWSSAFLLWAFWSLLAWAAHALVTWPGWRAPDWAIAAIGQWGPGVQEVLSRAPDLAAWLGPAVWIVWGAGSAALAAFAIGGSLLVRFAAAWFFQRERRTA